MEENDLIEFPVDGTLDLHTFRPQEVKELIPEYLAVCRRQGIHEVRIIHGKGSGTLRRIVHSLLQNLHEVRSFQLTSEEAGGWGATIVRLKTKEDKNTVRSKKA